LTSLGTRYHPYTTSTGQAIAGLRGQLGQNWNWNVTFDYGHTARTQLDENEIDIPALQAAIDAGVNIFDQAVNGPAFEAFGALYRKQSMNYTVDPRALLDPVTANCEILQEGCGSPGSGSDNVKELYAETLIPLLKEVPGAYSLNVDLGIRASDYDSAGSTTNKKLA